MGVKKYEFCVEEIAILRNALIEYKHFLTPPPDASDGRKHTYQMVCALADQFKQDMLSLKL